MLLADLCCNCKLLFCLKLGSAGTDNIETAGISVLINVFVIKDQVIILD